MYYIICRWSGKSISKIKHCAKIDAGDGSYPSVNMCAHYLKLPDYLSQEVMSERLIMATNEKRVLLELDDFESSKY